MPGTGLVLDDCFLRHETGQGHPERPDRLRAIRSALQQAGLLEACARVEPEAVDPNAILANHTAAYVERLAEHCRTGSAYIDCLDSRICPASDEVARLACGAVLRVVDQVATGRLRNGFCALRPPGHHAEADRSMGFCLYNNIAIAAHHLIDQHDVQRVLILDWDVHHGNGTQHSFDSDPRVFCCSFHGHPATLYPGTGYESEVGSGAGRGTTLNITMMPGDGDAAYRKAFFGRFLTAARRFKPEFILVAAGFDAHRADPLALIELETSSFAWLTTETVALADELCGGRLVSMLEGGYDLQALGQCAVTHVEGLLHT